jgi:hypothetical protein
MTRRDDLEEARSPFLLEALQPAPAGPDPQAAGKSECQCGSCHQEEESSEEAEAYETSALEEADESWEAEDEQEADEAPLEWEVEPSFEEEAEEGSPFLAEAGPEEEHERQRGRTPPVAKSVALKPHLAAIKGELFRVDTQAAPKTAIFVPAAVQKTGAITALVWIHGDLICSDGPDALSHVQSETISLVKILADSKRAFVLIAPSMGWDKGQPDHPLGAPKTMNAFLEEVRQSLVGAGWAAAPTIDRLILAGHSHAFAVFYGLAEAADHAASWKDSLAKLTDVWWLDATYGKRNPHTFSRKLTFWAAFKRNVNFSVLYIPGSDTAKVAELVELKAKAGPIPIDIRPLPRDGDEKTDDHCLMPKRQMGALLKSAK